MMDRLNNSFFLTAIQTDPQRDRKLVIPIPVPIYVPVPCHMYSTPVPFPVPFVLPVPVPIFIPTTRNSAKGILKEIQKIKTKVPADPLEAELLMMAEMVAEDKKVVTDSSSEEETEAETNAPEQESMKTEEPFSDPAVENAQFGEDMLQMALKMASDFEEPVDLEGAVSASTISGMLSLFYLNFHLSHFFNYNTIFIYLISHWLGQLD